MLILLFFFFYIFLKQGFSMMDWDKDGILGKEDLRATWDKVGKLVTDPELDTMLGEASGPVNFTQLLTLFATRMADGGLWIVNVYNLNNYTLLL